MALKAVQPVSAILLARLLLPADYGVFGMALAVTTAIDLFREMGLVPALAQRRRWSERVASTAFLLALGLGVLAAALTFALSVPAARLFGEPRVGPVLEVLSAFFLINAAAPVHRALLVRRMDFRRLFRCTAAGTLANPCVAIPLAFAGAAEWALVSGLLAGSLATTAALWQQARWRPRPIWRRRAVPGLLHFGLNVFAESAMVWLVGTMDVVFLARFSPTAAVGQYRMAQQVGWWPATNITGQLSNVILSATSRLRTDRARLALGLHKALRLLALVVLPLGSFVAVSAGELVPTLLGTHWSGTVPVIRPLALAGIAFSLAGMLPAVYRGLGLVQIMPRFMLVRTVLSIPAYYWACQHGVVALSWTHVGFVCVFAPTNFYICARVLGVAYRSFVHDLRGGGAGAVIIVAGYALSRALTSGLGLPAAATLASGALLAFGTYLAYLRRFHRADLHELAGVVTGRTQAS